MQPLLKIQTVPIAIEYNVKRASLQQTSSPAPKHNVTRQKGAAQIKTTPGRLHIDSSEARASAGLKSAPRLTREFAAQGQQDAEQAARQFGEDGNRILQSHGKGSPIAEIAASKLGETKPTITQFIPSVRPEITGEPGTVSFDYTMDKLTFDWHINTRPQLEYIPGSVEFTVTQYPQVLIEYLGQPIYVPASADPNYVPPPQATIIDQSV